MDMTEMTGLLMDGILIMLLGAVLFACIRVNGRLIDMRKGQNELAGLMGRLESSTKQAQDAVSHLRKESAEAIDDLSSASRKARALADELTLITEAGDNLANRLEKRLTSKHGGDENVTPIRSGRPDLLKALKEAR
ncbi:hypothetical protein JCM17844_03820 [Iodidimonas gelatinilytica]|uniref:DUF6468 domain-containing protein n=1 Tax=Iodidimonas gelatinilytica TaxID=1236966 RepID=A0A5A7MP00_9PROT|nr:DUF6468 domain-containing protein [Iodidimonas gelatinilytica]GEQ96745.1 hypothetical protein JCM17844_03820 [Iodidimonas gelatinilytica]GER01468.1 hypothetical protein JCM17845_20910 [Iodidimonas gelatinilytica]